MRVVEGPLFSEVVTYYQHFQQTIRIHNVPGTHTQALYPSCIHAHNSVIQVLLNICVLHASGVDGLSLDITTLVDIRDQNNKELAMRLVTDIQSEDKFYTDLNGLQVSFHSFLQSAFNCSSVYCKSTL